MFFFGFFCLFIYSEHLDLMDFAFNCLLYHTTSTLFLLFIFDYNVASWLWTRHDWIWYLSILCTILIGILSTTSFRALLVRWNLKRKKTFIESMPTWIMTSAIGIDQRSTYSTNNDNFFSEKTQVVTVQQLEWKKINTYFRFRHRFIYSTVFCSVSIW